VKEMIGHYVQLRTFWAACDIAAREAWKHDVFVECVLNFYVKDA
jgi:hypothetical protein